MSFDVFLQAFSDGDAARADADAVRGVLAPYVTESDQSGFARLVMPGGGADLHGYNDLGSGLMVSHISGDETWDLLVRAAKTSDLAIIPVGCPTCVTSGSAAANLPVDLACDVRLVETGAELRSVLEEAE